MAKMTKRSYHDQGITDAHDGNTLRQFPPAREGGSPSWQQIAYMHGYTEGRNTKQAVHADRIEGYDAKVAEAKATDKPVTTFAPGSERPWPERNPPEASGTDTGRWHSAEPAPSNKPKKAIISGVRWMDGMGIDLATGTDMAAAVVMVDGEVRSMRQIEDLDFGKVEERIFAAFTQSGDAFKDVDTAMQKAAAAMQKFGQVSVAQELLTRVAPQPRKFPGKLNYVMSLCRQKA